MAGADTPPAWADRLPIKPRKEHLMLPSQEYRRNLRYGVRVLATAELEAALCPRPENKNDPVNWAINDMSMDQLETAFELLFGSDPRRLAPKDYRPRRQ